MTSDEILSMAREAGFSVRGETIRTMHSSVAWVCINDELEKFAELVTRSERAARIEAQQRLEEMQELAAKSGLAHRKAVQAAVAKATSEAVDAEREECARVCDELQTVPATEPRHCAADIRARGMP